MKLKTIFLCALLFRLLFALWGCTSWFAEPQSLESQMYFRQGYGIAAGYGDLSTGYFHKLYSLIEDTGQRVTPGTAPPFDTKGVPLDMSHPPGMAMLIGGLYRALAVLPEWPIQVVGMLLDSTAAVILCWLVSKAFSPDVGFATGLIYAFFPPLAFAATFDLMPEGIMAVFIVGAVACVWKSLQPGATGWLGWCLLAALSLGVGSYFRPDFLLLPVALGAGAWALTHQFWNSFRNLITVQLLVIVLLLPWANRNHQACGRWVFTSSGVGATLVTGLGEYDNSWGIAGTDKARAKEAAAQGIDNPFGPEGDVYFRAQYAKYLSSHPGGYVKSVLKRIPMAIAPPLAFGFQNPNKEQTFAQMRDNSGMDRFSMLKSKFFYVVKAYWEYLAIATLCFLALIAWCWLAWRERSHIGVCFFLFSPYLYTLGAHMLTHYEPRFLLPALGFLLIGPGYVAAVFARKVLVSPWPATVSNS